MARRQTVEMMVAEAAARQAALDRGDDPGEAPEVVAAREAVAMGAVLARRVSDPPGDGYSPLSGYRPGGR